MKKSFCFSMLAIFAFAFVSCGSDPDTQVLQGHLWTGQATAVNSYDETETDQVSLIFTGENSGTAFFFFKFDDEEPLLGLSADFTYTLNDGDGSMTLSVDMDDFDKSAIKSARHRIAPHRASTQYVVPFTYDEQGNTIILDLGAFAEDEDFELITSSFTLSRGALQTPSSLKDTHWSLEIDETIENWDDGETVRDIYSHCLYRVDFTSDSKGFFGYDYSEEDDPEEDESINWDFTYTFTKGVGRFTINVFGTAAKGTFFLPDNNHLAFLAAGDVYIMQRL